MRAISAPTSAARFSKVLGQFSAQIQAVCDEPTSASKCCRSLVRRGGSQMRRPGECAIEMIFRQLKVGRTRPKKRRCALSGREGRLHSHRRRSAPAACGSSTSTPPPARSGLLAASSLEELVKLAHRQGSRSSASSPRSIRMSASCAAMQSIGETEPDLLRKFETTLGFALAPRRADRPQREGS